MFPHLLSPMPSGHPAYPLDFIPVGSVISFAGEVTDRAQNIGETQVESWGWMVCDGRSLKIGQYPQLYAVLGKRYGNNGDDDFKLPDMRGYFLRGVDDGSRGQELLDKDIQARDKAAGGSAESVGSTQKFALQSHEHKYQAVKLSAVSQGGSGAGIPPTQLKNTELGPQDALGADPVEVSLHETRSVNIYVHFIIKFATLPMGPASLGHPNEQSKPISEGEIS